MVWDGDCAFCKKFAHRFQKVSKNTVEFIPNQNLHKKYPGAPKYDYQNSVYFLTKEGFTNGAEAIFNFYNIVGKKWPKKVYENSSFLANFLEFLYRLVASNRKIFSLLGEIFYGDNFLPDTYKISSWVFGRSLGLVSIIAFLSLFIQSDLLISSKGVIPFVSELNQIESFITKSNLDISKWYAKPTLLWLFQNDLWLNTILMIGILASLTLFIGIMPHISILVAYVCYLSATVVSEPFLNFQWDALLLETFFLSIFFVPWKIFDKKNDHECPSRIGRWLLWLLIIKLMFQSGLVKFTFFGIDGANTWRNLTALNYHYWTQPIPSWISYYIDKLPLFFDKISLLFTYFCELIVPFLIFFPRRIKRLSGLVLILFQFLIIMTGNYGFFNFLTIVICFTLFDDQYLKYFFSRWYNYDNSTENVELYHEKFKYILSILVFICFISTTIIFVKRDIKGSNYNQVISTEQSSDFEKQILELAQVSRSMNAYGLFRVMTKTRPEIKIELQSINGQWHPVLFKYKPGNERKRPPFFFPHMPRLDWQIWFEALYYERLLSDPFALSTYQTFLSTLVIKDLDINNIRIRDFLDKKGIETLDRLPSSEKSFYMNRLSSRINIYLNNSYWFGSLLSNIVNGNKILRDHLNIDEEVEYVNMRVSLNQFSFDHSNNDYWWKSEKINSFNIELN
tara:strand:- start:409 stop:2445 length:2037 start_codon:yes stop_codon:yes gene_type:complete